MLVLNLRRGKGKGKLHTNRSVIVSREKGKKEVAPPRRPPGEGKRRRQYDSLRNIKKKKRGSWLAGWSQIKKKGGVNAPAYSSENKRVEEEENLFPQFTSGGRGSPNNSPLSENGGKKKKKKIKKTAWGKSFFYSKKGGEEGERVKKEKKR